MSVDTPSLLMHMQFLANMFRKEDIHYVISLILMELGVNTNHVGYDYLLKGITIYVREPERIRAVGLYQAIAMAYPDYVTTEQIEHAIRIAIAAAWKKFPADDWFRYFSPETSGKLKKPCNTAFISQIARVLELWEGCCLKNMQEACKEDMV